MLFSSLRTKQKEVSEKVARHIATVGKRRFLIRTSLPAGIIPWLAVNLFFLERIRSEGIGGTFLVGLEAVALLISTLFGILISLRMWKRFEQNAKSS